MPRTIAPVLSALLSDLRAKVRPGKAGAGDAQVIRIAGDELRAFRRLAREVEASTLAHGVMCGRSVSKPCDCGRDRLYWALGRLLNPPPSAGKGKR